MLSTRLLSFFMLKGQFSFFKFSLHFSLCRSFLSASNSPFKRFERFPKAGKYADHIIIGSCIRLSLLTQAYTYPFSQNKSIIDGCCTPGLFNCERSFYQNKKNLWNILGLKSCFRTHPRWVHQFPTFPTNMPNYEFHPPFQSLTGLISISRDRTKTEFRALPSDLKTLRWVCSSGPIGLGGPRLKFGGRDFQNSVNTSLKF